MSFANFNNKFILQIESLMQNNKTGREFNFMQRKFEFEPQKKDTIFL